MLTQMPKQQATITKNRNQHEQSQTTAPTPLLMQQLPTQTTVTQQSIYENYKRTTMKTATQTTMS